MIKKLYIFVLFIQAVAAIPKFNTVNSVYHNGTMCPALTQKHVECPLLCVKDHQACPTALSACSNGLLLCSDGSCRSVCTKAQDLSNKCASCPSSNVQLKTCLIASSVYVDIPNYQPNNATIQMYETCSQRLLNAGKFLSASWDDVKQEPLVWNVCNPPKGMIFPIQANTVIIYLSVFFTFFPLWALWAFYKYTREKNLYAKQNIFVNKDANQSSPVINESVLKYNDDNIEYQKQEDEELIQKGFKNDYFGNVMVAYMALISVFWLIILLVLCLDYYGYVISGTPFGLFYDSYDLSSKAFCLAWCLSTAWYLIINLSKSNMRNHFRIQTTFERADHIQIEKPRRVIQMHHDSTQQPSHFKALEKITRQLLGFDMLVHTVPVMQNNQHKYFEFQSTRYNLDHTVFRPAQVNVGETPIKLLSKANGLDHQTASTRLEILRPNFIQVKVPSFIHAFWQELTGFFYIYQLQILWCYFYLAYWQIGLSDTCVILLAAFIKVMVRLKSEKRVKNMAEHVDTCLVLRDNAWSTLLTSHLVPGDIIQITPKQIVPIDGVILHGDIIVDESSLTGEPLPIRKFPLRVDVTEVGKTNSLYAGTTIKQALSNNHQPATALVLKTGTNTDKGQLVQRILFPQPVSFIFNEQLKLVFCLLLLWALVLLGFGAWWLGSNGMTAWFYGTVCAAQVMNPLLPAILVVGQSIAAKKLKQQGVFCVDLPRILMAGKVQVFCFDKTGTLTHEGLSYYGAHSVVNHELDVLQTTFEQVSPVLQMGLASCHSITTVEGEYVGNPVDIVMFQSTGATLNQDVISTHQGDLTVIQRFEFLHARASMAIAVKDLKTGHTHIYCKGSFERIAETCQGSVPSNFDDLTISAAKSGCYVLAMAHRDLGILSEKEEHHLRNNATRDDLETCLEVIGLVLFKNQLKEDTATAIQQIKQGDVRVVMITGDNALTGVFIGQQCHLVPEHAIIILGSLVEDEKEKICNLVWTNIETGNQVIEIDAAIQSGCELALTGKAFRWLVERNQMRQYLFNTRIFARMTPVDKMICVELMMEKSVTAMCGDGGNDCGALRTAHVGIAMSEAEASVVSPFNTPDRSVQACVSLLIQGRAALATSFASYKYLIMYGQTMATVKFLTFYYTMSFSQWNFILIDAFITVFCAFGVTQAAAAKTLSHHRPTARILGPEVLLSVLGQLFINVWFLAGAFIWLYTRDDFFRCHEWDARAIDNSKWWLLGDSFEADVLTFIALFQFVNSSMIFNYGYIFRARWYHNYFLILVWAIFVAIVSYWELADPNPFGCLMRVNCGNPDVLESLGYPRPNFYIEPYNNPLGHNVLPKAFRYELWGYSIVNMVVAHLWERFFVLGPVRQWTRKRWPLKRLAVKL